MLKQKYLGIRTESTDRLSRLFCLLQLWRLTAPSCHYDASRLLLPNMVKFPNIPLLSTKLGEKYKSIRITNWQWQQRSVYGYTYEKYNLGPGTVNMRNHKENDDPMITISLVQTPSRINCR